MENKEFYNFLKRKNLLISTYSECFIDENHPEAEYFTTGSINEEFISDCILSQQKIRRSKENSQPCLLCFEFDDIAEDKKAEIYKQHQQTIDDEIQQIQSKYRALNNSEYYEANKERFFNLLIQKRLLKKFFAKYKKNVLSMTFSGNKSVHMCVLLPNGTKQEEFTAYWDTINKQVFDGLADPSYRSDYCKLTRLPEATRQDNGKRQQLIYFNPEAEPIRLLLQRQGIKQPTRQKNTYTYTYTGSFYDYLKNIKTNHRGREIVLGYLQGSDMGANTAYEGFVYLQAILNSTNPPEVSGARELVREYIEKAKALHPTNLPDTAEKYIDKIHYWR